MLDLTGQKYGILTILREAERKNDKRVWTCLCECGNIKDIRQDDLRSGKTLSCGCLGAKKRLEATQNKQVERKENPKPYKDLTGQRFSRLLVLEFDRDYTKLQHQKENSPKFSYWKCQCDCGNILTVKGADITNGHTKSCGCLIKEKASKNMKENIQNH